MDLRVVATAGHVDHGKSSLIVRLTGIDPDRFAEEKRRGLTIDLGYAWCELPSGREVGFVDVPGHERFIANMLAGVGPVRLVVFVVAADEGWKPQSEEHLQILDVLGVAGGVVALTKCDLTDAGEIAATTDAVRGRLAGTRLATAPIVPVSSVTGEGIEDLRRALDDMISAAPPPEPARIRLFVDRVFSIKGAGTVVTGTLTGGSLRVGDEIDLLPGGYRGRVRTLQTHKRSEDEAHPVSRVAANLAGPKRTEISRGDVLVTPGAWRPTRVFEATLTPVRGLAHAITAKGAFKVYAGAAEADARIRLYATGAVEAGQTAFARITTSIPLTLDVFDRFVVRDAGRRETVAGGTVLDAAPPTRAGSAAARLALRAGATRDGLPALLVGERGAVRTTDIERLTGSSEPGGVRAGDWQLAPQVVQETERALTESLAAIHAAAPLKPAEDLPSVRTAIEGTLRSAGVSVEPSLADAVLEDLIARGAVVRDGSGIRLAAHQVFVADDEMNGLLAAVGGEHETAPPTVAELRAAGFSRDLLTAAAGAGVIVRVGPDLIFTAAFVARAEEIVRAAGDAGITVSAFREALGTTRKYAVPLLEAFDQRGVTTRVGDVRIARVR